MAPVVFEMAVSMLPGGSKPSTGTAQDVPLAGVVFPWPPDSPFKLWAQKFRNTVRFRL